MKFLRHYGKICFSVFQIQGITLQWNSNRGSKNLKSPNIQNTPLLYSLCKQPTVKKHILDPVDETLMINYTGVPTACI